MLLAALALCAGGAGGGPDDAARRQPFRSQDPRSDLDDRLHRAQPRLHDLRHAVRARRQSRDQAADGRQVDDLRRQAHLDLHPARRARVPRRHAGHRRGRRALAQALGRARCAGPAPVDQGRRGEGARSQDLPDPCSRRRPASCCRRWAKPSGNCRSSCPSRSPRPTRSSRSTTTPAPARSSSRRTSGSPATRRSTSRTPSTSRAPSRPRGLAGGKIAKVDRVEWVAMPDQQTAMNALMKGEIDMIETPQHDLFQAHGGRPEHQAGQPQQVGQPVHLPLQPAAQAVRQSQGPPGAALRLQPEGLPRRRDRRSRVLQGLQGDVHVRHAVREHRRASRTSSRATSPRPRSS